MSPPPATRRRIPRRVLRRLAAVFGCVAGGALLGAALLWLFLPFPEDCLKVRPPQSTLLVDRHGEPLRVFLGDDGSFSLWVPLEDFGEWLPEALVAAEDKRFREHCGIDAKALLRAMWQDVRYHRRVSGASTISTQVIRLAQPRPRTLRTKFLELFLATQMERVHTKDEILEQYLNRAPFGGNFTGAEAASRRYFGKRARDLSLAEAALLAGLPQSPTRHRPDIHPENARRRRAYVLGRMLDLGMITPGQHAAANAEPLPTKLSPYPFFAPHFCNGIARSWDNVPPGGTIRTTLDLGMQRLAERALRERVGELHGVGSGALLVLRTDPRETVAWVGSPDFSDSSGSGQYDHALAWRSPGSALKPFAFALALEQGRINPASALRDLPRQYAAFAPGNFDGTHRGVVSARDALVQSLNAPALDIVQTVGVGDFIDALHGFGIWEKTRLSRERNGLGIVLGNAEVRLADLVAAYARLGRLASGAGDGPVSPAAAWITLDMLSGDERAEVETGSQADVRRIRAAWKTGTSAGFRDAWTLAVTPTYTIGAWLGNSDARPAQALVGIEAAAPLVFRVLRSLPLPPAAPEWFARPDTVGTRRVCAATGDRPGPHCGATVETWAIPNTTVQRVCDVHRDADGDGVAEESWPADIQAFRAGRDERGAVAARPVILSPAPGAVLSPGPANASNGTLPFRARGTGTLWWFLDGEFLAEADASAPVRWKPVAGRHELRCCDASGAFATVSFEVQ